MWISTKKKVFANFTVFLSSQSYSDHSEIDQKYFLEHF